jgi:hypothetical protein
MKIQIQNSGKNEILRFLRAEKHQNKYKFYKNFLLKRCSFTNK